MGKSFRRGESSEEEGEESGCTVETCIQLKLNVSLKFRMGTFLLPDIKFVQKYLRFNNI